MEIVKLVLISSNNDGENLIALTTINIHVNIFILINNIYIMLNKYVINILN